MVQYSRASNLDVHDAAKLADYYFQFDDTPTLWAPLGMFLEIHPHPWKDAGPFIGLTLSVGYLPGVANPRPNTIDMPMYLVGYALEVGYETSRSHPHSFGAFLRYSAWTGGESVLSTDFPEGFSVGELTIGARWAFRP